MHNFPPNLSYVATLPKNILANMWVAFLCKVIMDDVTNRIPVFLEHSLLRKLTGPTVCTCLTEHRSPTRSHSLR